jgi:hypothetical protein
MRKQDQYLRLKHFAVAITVLIYVEEREAAVFGKMPDPIENTRDMDREWVDKVATYTTKLRWDMPLTVLVKLLSKTCRTLARCIRLKYGGLVLKKNYSRT